MCTCERNSRERFHDMEVEIKGGGSHKLKFPGRVSQRGAPPLRQTPLRDTPCSHSMIGVAQVRLVAKRSMMASLVFLISSGAAWLTL